MIRGMSFQKGVMFMGKKYLACSYEENNKHTTWVKPVNGKTMLAAGRLVFFSMPFWYHAILLVIVGGIGGPLGLGESWPLPALPFGALVLFLAGTHFYFPSELKRYHGAEHKVFSCKERISIVNRKHISNAEITNRNCSTNAIVLYFFMFVLSNAVLLSSGLISGVNMVMTVSSLVALLLMPFLTYWLNRTKETSFHRGLLTISYWLQRHVTTKEPKEKHVKAAIRSYRKLAMKEFPEKVRNKSNYVKKPTLSIATADISVVPIGDNTKSDAEYLAQVKELLTTYEKSVTWTAYERSIVIEAPSKRLFNVLQAIHDLHAKENVERVITTIRVDERRSRESQKSAHDQGQG
ncbi:DUF1385 domain-containing protein [Alteribacter aurantiacus]|uniref:DUF1385 domain-containing protein n=1 Tax=Alteribacter aurantiacus TaxID=254410 RepID=UPI00040CE445|nr:DUF1385 domain-containing protein [Alteribacter aurantiacus]